MAFSAWAGWQSMAALQLAVLLATPSAEPPAHFLSLRPAALPSHQALNLVNGSGPSPFSARGMTTWGGSVVLDPQSGLHHIFAAERHKQ